MTDCPRLGKLFGGCKFSPRYDIVSATGPDSMTALWSIGHPLPRPTPGRTTYLCDVCERCGKMLFRRRSELHSERTAPGDATAKPSKTGSTR